MEKHLEGIITTNVKTEESKIQVIELKIFYKLLVLLLLKDRS